MNIREIVRRLDLYLVAGPTATLIAVTVFAMIVVGGVGTVRSGRWPFRLLLLIGAVLWPLPTHPLQGPVVLKISYLHGIHTADLLSVVAVVAALTPWQRLKALANATR